MSRRILLLAAACLVPAAPQAVRAQPPASVPKVELRGEIERVQLLPGQGMPFLELRDGDGLHRVHLGSMRYLIEKNFKPASGDAAVVQGIKVPNGVLAIRVEVPSAKMSIYLRDDSGEPLWRRGRHGWRKR